MADVDTSQLSAEHGAIRHDVAVESARLGNLIGAEACGINKHIGDMRQEDAENFGHTRRDIQATSADIRREGAEHTNEIVKEGIKSSFDVRGDVKDARYDIAARVGDQGDRVVDRVSELRGVMGDRFFAVGRDLSQLAQGQATLSKDIELNGLKSQIEAQKNTQYLSDKIALDGEKTRNLIQDLKYHDLNRGLLERQNELVNCEHERRHYHDRYNDARWEQNQAQFGAQWAQLQSQVQAFQSQLQETRQGMVNFGTMAGVGQTSTANNVR